MKYQKEKLSTQSHLQLHQQIPRNKFNQRGKHMYLENHETLKQDIKKGYK